MRHKISGRTLGRNASHRKAMFRNMAASFIKTLRQTEGAENNPKVPGRIITTVPKAKELRPFIEKLITLAKKAITKLGDADQFKTTAARNTPEWKSWRDSEQWSKWSQARSPIVNARRRAFSALRDKLAVEILFDELAPRFTTRPGGYTRIVKLANFRIGDAGQQALIEFVGERDRVKVRKSRQPAPALATETSAVSAPEVATPAAE